MNPLAEFQVSTTFSPSLISRRKPETLVALVTPRGEGGGQIVVGVAEPRGARDPHLLAAQLLAQGLQDANLVVDPVDPLRTVGRLLDDDVPPLGPHDAVNRDLGRAEKLSPIRLGRADLGQRVGERLMRAVVGMEVERGEQLGHHAPVIGAVGGANRLVDAPRRCGAGRERLLDQRRERALVDYGEDYLAHGTVGRAGDRGRHLEQDASVGSRPVHLQGMAK